MVVDETNTVNYFFDEYLGSEDCDQEISWALNVSQHDDVIIVNCHDFTSAAVSGKVDRWVDLLAKGLNNTPVAPFNMWKVE